jgi:aspartate/methionine/tyrosine aminotransferase
MTTHKFTQRSNDISPFHVMDILAQAKQLESRGKQIIHMEIGEPDFDTPSPIVEMGIKALQQGKTHYTPAVGLYELRVEIAQWYETRYKVSVAPERVIITPGASGALLLIMGALLDKDKQVLMADPGYPCNKNFARFVEGKAKSIPVDENNGFQLTAKQVEDNWQTDTAMALIASPSNPTGTLIENEELRLIADVVKKNNGALVVDEIYHGLTYDGINEATALSISDDVFVINSFSKFFGMTGWRLGWLIVPDGYTDVMDKLAQNLFLAAPTMSQYAALAAFEPSTLEILEMRRAEFEQRRNVLLPALRDIGFDITITPQGAFYLYANCKKILSDRFTSSMDLSRFLLKNAGVAITPGNDFGTNAAIEFCRFAYTTDSKYLLDAVERMEKILKIC